MSRVITYQPETEPEAAGGTPPPGEDVFREMLAARSFNAAIIPSRPIPILRLGDHTISTPGNLTNIQAPAKAGKSAVVAAIIAAMFNGGREEADTLGFSATNLEEKAVIHFDTEQSRYDHDGLIRRAMSRARVESPPVWFHSFCLTDLSTANREIAIETAIEQFAEEHGGIFAIIIDGVADICRDPNNPEESFALVDKLHATAIQNDCAILTVLHENPGSDSGKMRGHLGSQLERKAETPLRLAKAANGITTVWCDRARHCHIPKEQGSCFQWSDIQGMHISCGDAGEIKRKETLEKARTEAAKVFENAPSYRHGELITAIRKALEVSDGTAKNRYRTWKLEGIITQSESETYHLTNPGNHA